MSVQEKTTSEFCESGIEPSLETKPKEVSQTSFLRTLKTDIPIKRIYYPGFEKDFLLELAFDPSEIYYLDNNKYATNRLKKRGQHVILGDMRCSPFKDDAFDAVFIKDIHANRAKFMDIIRTLRIGGIVIYSTVNCGEKNQGINLKSLKEKFYLKEMAFSVANDRLFVFRKVANFQ